MAIAFNDNIQPNAPKILDNRYSKNGVTPYVDVAEANSTIPITYRSKGLTVLIGNQEYWYRDGITDVDLIIKTSGGSSNFLEEKNTSFSGTIFNLANIPVFIFGVYLGGQRLTEGVDYNVSGSTVTFVTAQSSESVSIVYAF